MKKFHKLINVILVLLILVTTFMPPFIQKAHAEENVTLDKAYKLYMYYPSATTDLNKVIINSYDTYALAKEAMNKIESEPYATAMIENNGIVIDADYALVHMDRPGGGGRIWNDNIIYIYEKPSDISAGRKELTYVAGTWGVDAAFLEYNEQYRAYKIKISGVVGWIRMDSATIIPIAPYYGYTAKYTNNSPKVNITATEGIRMRTDHSVSSPMVCDLCYAAPGQTYIYYPEKTYVEPIDPENPDATRYTWYYIKNGGYEGYIASENENWVKIVNTLLTDTFYYAYNNNIYHYIHRGIKYLDYSQLIGEAPFYYSKETTKSYFLKNNYTYCDSNTYTNITSRYLSFDGNYFYTDFKDMIDDYRDGTYTRAVNAEHPYYAYFQYQPSRVKSGMSAETINQQIINSGVTSGLTHDIGYYYDANGNVVNNIGTESILYNTGELFVKAANVYGVSPLTIYTAAMRESGYGRSAIALRKNNLFGYGANDATPFQSALTYASIYDSMVHYASQIGGTGGYADINNYRYYGTHKGNKQSGTNVIYMSDPYGGDKDSGSAYLADRNSGSVEIYSNTIGIKNKNNLVNIYAEPSEQSRVIYTTKNYVTGFILSNIPFIVEDKIYVYENEKYQGYYKVYTDLSLNENRYVDINTIYNFNYSYGYIKEEELYVQNNQPVITANDIEVIQFEEIDLKKNVSATDYEDGILTSKIQVEGTVDISQPGVYPIKYTVEDNSKFSSSKVVNVTVNPTKAPIIEAPEVSIPQYTTFDELEGVTVTDNTDGNITSSIEVVSNNLNANVLGTYTIVYKVTNSLNITTTKERIIKVINNEYPILNVENKTIFINDSFDKKSIATAYDKEDGEITNNIKISGEVNSQETGMYELTYSVSDSVNQITSKTIIVTVENKVYAKKDNIFQLEELIYNEETKKVEFLGFIIIKDTNNALSESINYSIIFENQFNNNRIIKNLTRLTSNQPYINNIENYSNEGAWFKESLDLSDIPTGNYNVYVRARSESNETEVTLRNTFFKEKVSSKFEIDDKGYQFRTNYFNKYLSIELIVREEGLISNQNNPTIDNMYNPVYSMTLDGSKLNLIASSHNVNGDYGVDAEVERYIMFENIATNETYLKKNVGFITDGPYKISLKVSDGYDKTKAWYKTTIDLKDLPTGKYSVIVNTKTGDINDYGELYDIFKDHNISSTANGKKITITRNQNIRYRIEITIE